MILRLISLCKKIGFGLGSSRWLARSLVRYSGIPNQKNLTILELWAWYGNTTQEILRHKKNISSLTLVEYRKECIEHLNALSGSNTQVIHGDARDISQFLEKESVDIVISTLPLWSLNRRVVDEILSEVQSVLKKWGTFIQYQYWMANKKDIKKYFLLKKIKLELRNFTPAWIYVTEKSSPSENIAHH